MRSKKYSAKMRSKKLHKVFRGNNGIEHDFPDGYERPQGNRCLRRPRSTARRNRDQAVLRVAPRICTRAARAAANSAAMYKRGRTHAQPEERLGPLYRAVSLNSSARLNHLLGVFDRWVLTRTLSARADPRSATRHRWRFIVATTPHAVLS